ncbi:MAG: asparaginase [Phycisphaerales bacterium]|jgi:L-asparaginase|nr:asparaginase [Phycisphaerales bacterium]
MRHVTLITTGGTIEKTYDEATGTLDNRRSIVRRMLRRLRLEDTVVHTVELMSKDSLLMTDDDRARILEVVRATCGTHSRPDPTASTHNGGVVILHGTDTLCTTGDLLHQRLPDLAEAVVLTGAMRPYEMTRSDALQNLTEAVFAAGMLPPGVYVAAHGRVLKFPGVRKDRDRGTFVRVS